MQTDPATHHIASSCILFLVFMSIRSVCQAKDYIGLLYHRQFTPFCLSASKQLRYYKESIHSYTQGCQMIAPSGITVSNTFFFFSIPGAGSVSDSAGLWPPLLLQCAFLSPRHSVPFIDCIFMVPLDIVRH